MPTPELDPSATDLPPASDDGTVTVEAATTQQAMEAVSARLGPCATIVRADRVVRGGVGGFFGKQMVQLTAAPPGGASPAKAPTDADGGTPAVGAERTAPALADAGAAAVDGLDATLQRLSADADGREEAFGDALRRHLRVDPARPEPATTGRGAAATATATTAVSAPSPAATPVTEDGERRRPSPNWSPHELHRLRLPDRLIEQVVRQSPASDQEWLLAVADAVASLCRPLPAGDAVLVGPRAAAIGAELGVPVYADRERPAPSVGPLAVAACDIPADVATVEAVRGDRWVHLLVSGPGRFDHLVTCEPLAVSWVGDVALPEALDLCSRFGLVLGYRGEGTDGQAAPHRAGPLDVATAVRRMLPR